MEPKYYATIGLEIHAELNTKSKMFCGCLNNPDETVANTNICPVCMAHPGTLPVPNKEAIKKVIQVGLALGSNIADFTEFDRKNYFYPDIPKGYQISQYKYPIVAGGNLNGFDITRIHLEEDTGLSKHDRGDFSLVDYNRAGVALMELVTEPVIHSASDAASFGRELQLLLRTLGVSDANMDKGEMRLEPNVSLSNKKGVLTTKVEIKNINSFKSVEKAIAYELARMEALYEAGREDEIVQETRGWDENKQSTFSQRSKENANDYRYFPDPDIPKFYLAQMFDMEAMKKELPELPVVKRARFAKDFGLKEEHIEIYLQDKILSDYFENVADLSSNEKDYFTSSSNFILNDVLSTLSKDLNTVKPKVEYFADLIKMFISNRLSSRAAKDILLKMMSDNTIEPKKYAEENNLLQNFKSDELSDLVSKIILDPLNEGIIKSYKAGKENALMALVGMVMKETKGSANPAITLEILKEFLK